MARSAAPRIAFCTTCKGRTQHLKQTLSQNLADNARYGNAVFVVLDYSSQDDLLGYLREAHQADLASGRLVVYSLREPGPFRMAHAKNVAHRLGILHGAEILVNMDADNFTGNDFASYIAETFERAEEPIFLWACMIQRCNAACEDAFCVLPRWHNPPCSELESELDRRFPRREYPRVRGITGRIVVSTNAFLKVGGYDEKFSDWGPDDKDFEVRLRRLWYAPQEIPYRYLGAIHHGPKLRFKEYPHADPGDAYGKPIIPDAPTAVANFGRFGCAMLWRLGCDEPLELGPAPTRIFGIGMHKTGTVSLHEAFQQLGYDSAHWTTPRWARNVWTEVRSFGTSLTLERHYATCDFPLTVLFRELDEAYPGSKFILTLRDEVDWLRSVRDHWDAAINRWRSSWDEDCFTHAMHKRVYGRTDFDATEFLARYLQHNADVRGYFKDRPQDLLVWNLGDGWEPLCRFLGRPVPDAPYPEANRR